MLAALLFVGWIRVSPPSRLIGAVCNQCDRGTGSVAGEIESRVRGEMEALHHFFVGWFHIHETWLPEVVMSAGPHDF